MKENSGTGFQIAEPSRYSTQWSKSVTKEPILYKKNLKEVEVGVPKLIDTENRMTFHQPEDMGAQECCYLNPEVENIFSEIKKQVINFFFKKIRYTWTYVYVLFYLFIFYVDQIQHHIHARQVLDHRTTTPAQW